jgi:hypothetical protein
MRVWLWRAWALHCLADHTVVIEADGYAVAVVQARGAGELVLIADPLFFANRNLESERAIYKDNLTFLRWLLREP